MDTAHMDAAHTDTAHTDAVHVSVVLDRSGSMTSIADEVVAGFNRFLARQRAEDGEARITLAQFDDEDPFEVLIDGVPVREVTDMERSWYRPRGLTPLYDAVGAMIARADAEAARRAEAGADEEDQLVVIVTDGLENASREHTRSSVFDLISARREQGWSFLFLGADQDAYAAGGDIGMARANTAGWDKTERGTDKLWRDVSHTAVQYRQRSRVERRLLSDDVYREDPGSGG